MEKFRWNVVLFLSNYCKFPDVIGSAGPNNDGSIILNAYDLQDMKNQGLVQ